MTNAIARRPGLVKSDQINIRASKFSEKNTICIIRGLVTFWIPNFGLVHFKIICQSLNFLYSDAHTFSSAGVRSKLSRVSAGDVGAGRAACEGVWGGGTSPSPGLHPESSPPPRGDRSKGGVRTGRSRAGRLGGAMATEPPTPTPDMAALSACFPDT
jgi:hypothetical protein